jgi:hypothetical protein
MLAGTLVGPHTPGFVADAGLAEQPAEIGVILLMFGVGHLGFCRNGEQRGGDSDRTRGESADSRPRTPRIGATSPR